MQEIINQIYDYEKEENCYLIKLSPERYESIFNKLDYYPMRKRDINPNVIDYIEECSKDINMKYKVKLEITIKNQKKDLDLEERAKTGLYNNFHYLHAYYLDKSQKIIKRSSIYILLFITLILLSFSLDNSKIGLNKIFIQTLLEGLSIGAWVFLWEAIVGISIRNLANIKYIRIYKRLMNSKIIFSNQT